MNLTGNLGQLGLGDILQIISLSGKPGLLHIHGEDDLESKIFFDKGHVIKAYSSLVKDDIAAIISGSGLIKKESLEDVMLQYEDKGSYESYDSILIDSLDAIALDVDILQKKLIEETIYSLFFIETATFNFEPKNLDEYLERKADLFVNAEGGNPWSLAIEGTKFVDEAFEESLSRARKERTQAIEKPAEKAVAKHDTFAVILISNDDQAIEIIDNFLQEDGRTVYLRKNTEDALHLIETIDLNTTSLVVLSDLIMPTIDGTGALGGIELLDIISGGFPEINVILMADYENSRAKESAEKMGVSAYLDRPLKEQFENEGDRNLVDSFLKKLKDELQKFLGETGRIGGSMSFDMMTRDLHDEVEAVGELLEERGVNAGEYCALTPGLMMLKSMMEEMSNAAGSRYINLLILRFASELMNRAVIFLVKEDAFAGQGEFGVEIEGKSANAVVRAMKISKEAPSIVRDAFNSKSCVKKRIKDDEGDRTIIEALGGNCPEESFAAPVMANGKVAMIVYCDNIPEKREIGDTSAFEIFLMQAGIVMEKAVLEEKVGVT
ncbi:MAG: response regulator [Proteobacteria bacterium]|nr:response regulator [Pseudomonadota bacterium]